MSIRTIDLNDSIHGTDTERLKFAQDLFAGFAQEGFVKLVNHGFSETDIDTLFKWNKSLFEVSLDQKQRIANAAGPNPQRGWSSLGVEKTGTLNKPGKTNLIRVAHGELEDAKEHFDMGPADDDEFPNLWPDEDVLPGFQTWLQNYFDKSQLITLQLMQALEVAMGLPPRTFTDRCRGHASELRLNHYPAISVQKLKDGSTNRIWPHTDFGIITLLSQDARGGLEIQDKNNPGTFLPVQPDQRTELIVNIGDTLERWTNGILKAGLHQVTVPNHLKQIQSDEILPPRYSVAFFLKASRQTSVGPLPQFVLADRPALYDDISALVYQQRRTGVVY